jgi:hypothetical protein
LYITFTAHEYVYADDLPEETNVRKNGTSAYANPENPHECEL